MEKDLPPHPSGYFRSEYINRAMLHPSYFGLAAKRFGKYTTFYGQLQVKIQIDRAGKPITAAPIKRLGYGRKCDRTREIFYAQDICLAV
ncbi:hypothetical protein C6496_21150 [Candidatus Poribacteria bacterium]|nr:MAG: hypothetical protein C6496_21150 [Candidatus Poribacteria bacterium]